MKIIIKSLDWTLPDKIVSAIHWEAWVTDDEPLAREFGMVALEPKEPSDPSFIEWQDLTPDEVMTWLMANVNFSEVEQRLNEQLAAKTNPTSGLPWEAAE